MYAATCYKYRSFAGHLYCTDRQYKYRAYCISTALFKQSSHGVLLLVSRISSTTLWTNSVDDKLVIKFVSENRLRQIKSLEDNLHEMSEYIFCTK